MSTGHTEYSVCPIFIPKKSDGQLRNPALHNRSARIAPLKCHNHHCADLHLGTVERRECPALPSLPRLPSPVPKSEDPNCPAPRLGTRRNWPSLPLLLHTIVKVRDFHLKQKCTRHPSAGKVACTGYSDGLSPPSPDQVENECQQHAQENRSRERKVKGCVLPTIDNVTRQAP